MIGYFSPSAGSLLFEQAGTRFVRTLEGISERFCSKHAWTLSAIDDWTTLECSTENELIANFHDRSAKSRFLSLSWIALQGQANSLLPRVCIELEELLKTAVPPTWAVAHLLCAPLKDKVQLQQVSAAAATVACTALHAIVEEIESLQTPLRRLSIRWLRLPTSAWSEGPLAAQTLWGILIETQAIQPLLALLQSSQGNRFVTTWNSIVTLTLDKPDERRHSQSIANVLKNVLFDNAGSLEIARDDFVDEHEYESNISYRQDRPFRSGAENRRYYKEAQANIRQIVACIKTGEDDHARRYIEEFATKQVSRDDAQYAVKTLCSIGQKCNHILRYDMERTCLEAAISIDPDDAFALVQIGDHYKRVRQFERAAELLFRAKIYAERETALVVESSLADLQSVQGNYETAISMYMTIPGWESQIVVRTAIADCLRASGDFKGAKAAYLAIVEQWGPNLRVSMGIAELLKAEGELEKSLELYNQIVESTGELTRETWENDRELRIAWLSQINVLKRLERYQDAQLILERLKLLSPDDMTLRANLAVIYGLLGRSMVECLREVGPVPRPTVAHDWLRYCIRGLLQLKNGQTGEARNSLIARWDLSKHNNPDDALRLAAATAFLQVGDLNNATRVLASPNTKLDPFYQYIQLTLEYHVAKLSRNRAATADIQARLQPIAFSLPQFNAVIQAIDAGDFRGANRMVATLLLLAI